MRPSKRTTILEAAHRIVARDGLAGVTYEAIAEEAGLTKGGVVYHFGSRDELVVALAEFLAEYWDAAMVTAAGAPADQLTERERLEVYARESLQGTTNAELVMLMESADVPEARAAWTSVVDRWALPRVDDPPTDEQLDLLVLRLAADGLWIYDAIAADPMDHELRRQLVERIARAIRAGD
ncbi:MAG: TetR family transcriptional regulator [Patulibacter sp.]|nr:TetR family transcriptional regulator [Patulibacter sp.]